MMRRCPRLEKKKHGGKSESERTWTGSRIVSIAV